MPEDAATGLLLFVPPGTPAERLAAALRPGGTVAAILDATDPDAPALRTACDDAATACLALGEPAAARSIGATGVHLTDEGGVAAARASLGPDALIGAACGTSRHAAMVAGEDGADYIMFASPFGTPDATAILADLCDWWSELFVLPCAVDLRGWRLDPGDLVEAGADFIAVQEAVWDAAEGPAAAVRALSAVLERARAQRKVRL